jgi:hypothetical protein
MALVYLPLRIMLGGLRQAAMQKLGLGGRADTDAPPPEAAIAS